MIDFLFIRENVGRNNFSLTGTPHCKDLLYYWHFIVKELVAIKRNMLKQITIAQQSCHSKARNHQANGHLFLVKRLNIAKIKFSIKKTSNNICYNLRPGK